MEWTKALSVGHSKIDLQHKELIDNIEKIKELDPNNINPKEIDKLLNFIKDYTRKHFSEEEELLKKWNYPDLERHHTLHETFKKEINDSIINLRAKNYSKIYMSSIKIKLGSWLVSHIMNEDKKYMKYIK